MSTTEWITDRYPYSEEEYIYNAQGQVIPAKDRRSGEPWKPIPKCEPYVKPKRFVAMYFDNYKTWGVKDTHSDEPGLPNFFNSRDAAERIAWIYEEVMP